MIDGCAVTIPCHEKGELPVGLMLIGANGSDRKLLGVARAVEIVLGRGDAWQSGVHKVRNQVSDNPELIIERFPGGQDA